MAFISIRKAIPLLIVVPLITTVGLTSWIIYQGGQQQARGITVRLLSEVNERITNQVKDYLTEVQVNNQTAFIAKQSQLLKLDDFSTLQQYFWHRASQNTGMTYLVYGSEQGNSLAVQRDADGKMFLHIGNTSTVSKRKTYSLDEKGNQGALVKTTNYDARQRPWYKDAIRIGKPTWSSVYQSITTQGLGMAAVIPIYDANRKVQGVLANLVELTQINDFLQTVKVSPHGHSLILEKSGNMIASSVESPIGKINGKLQQLNVKDSKDPVIREAAKLFLDASGKVNFNRSDKVERIQNNELLSFSFQGEQYVTEAEHIRDRYGLDWVFIVIVPMSDFVGQLQAKALSSLAVGLLIAGLFTLFGLIVADRWIVQPLQKLTKAAKAIEANEFDPAELQLVTVRPDEIGQLAKILNEMAGVIFHREQHLQSRLLKMQHENDAVRKASSIATEQTGRQRIQGLLRRSQQIRATLPHQALRAEELLRSVVYFQSLNDSDFKKLLNIGYERTVQAGEVICQEGDIGDAFYIILAGSVEVYTGKPPERIRSRVAGEFFGELALLLGIPRTATVKAAEESILFVLDREGLQGLLQNNLQIADSISRRINQYKADLERQKEMLKREGLLEDETNFAQNSLQWIQQRMKTLFNISFKQPV